MTSFYILHLPRVMRSDFPRGSYCFVGNETGVPPGAIEHTTHQRITVGRRVRRLKSVNDDGVDRH
jgi:hypothetical protein